MVSGLATVVVDGVGTGSVVTLWDFFVCLVVLLLVIVCFFGVHSWLERRNRVVVRR